MLKKEAYFRLGQRIGAAACGIDANGLKRLEGYRRVMDSPEAAPFNRELCKLAAAAFEAEGEPNGPHAILFRNLANEETWSPGLNRFSDVVKEALAKQAVLGPAVMMANDRLGGGMMKTLMSLGVIGGAGAGSLAYLLSRNARQSSAENAELLERVRAFKQLKRDIQEDMANKDMIPMSADKQRRETYEL